VALSPSAAQQSSPFYTHFSLEFFSVFRTSSVTSTLGSSCPPLCVQRQKKFSPFGIAWGKTCQRESTSKVRHPVPNETQPKDTNLDRLIRPIVKKGRVTFQQLQWRMKSTWGSKGYMELLFLQIGKVLRVETGRGFDVEVAPAPST
jgi:hypothetical protein